MIKSEKEVIFVREDQYSSVILDTKELFFSHAVGRNAFRRKTSLELGSDLCDQYYLKENVLFQVILRVTL